LLLVAAALVIAMADANVVTILDVLTKRIEHPSPPDRPPLELQRHGRRVSNPLSTAFLFI